MEGKFKNKLGFILDIVKKINMYVFIFPEGDKREKMGQKQHLKRMMAENFSELTKNINPYIDSRILLTP